jgi:hypothetical protein
VKPRSFAILVCRFSISASKNSSTRPASQAHEVVVVLLVVELEDRLAGLEVVADQKARLLELREHAVDGREADVEAVGEQLPVDVLGGEVADARALEHVDDLEARSVALRPTLRRSCGWLILL